MARFRKFALRLDTMTVNLAPAQINVAAIGGMLVVRPTVTVLARSGTDWSTWELGQIFHKDGGFTEIGSWAAGNTTSQNASPGGEDWEVTFEISNGAIQIDVVGEDGKTIEWMAAVEGWAFEP